MLKYWETISGLELESFVTRDRNFIVPKTPYLVSRISIPKTVI